MRVEKLKGNEPILAEPKPTEVDGFTFVDFTDNDELDAATFEATLNGIATQKVVDVETSVMSNAKRALFFAFSQDAFEGGKVEFLIGAKVEFLIGAKVGRRSKRRFRRLEIKGAKYARCL